jgi:Arc/MetJ-type ribon-helix-helix transcriptional regulator
MARSITVNKKTRGRPQGQEFPISVQLRLSEKQAVELDAWVHASGGRSRSEAIRRLLDKALPKRKTGVLSEISKLLAPHRIKPATKAKR